MFGVGNIAAQPRSMQQPPAQPLNSSQPNPRAQVPPPLLSPQVIQYPANALTECQALAFSHLQLSGVLHGERDLLDQGGNVLEFGASSVHLLNGFLWGRKVPEQSFQLG